MQCVFFETYMFKGFEFGGIVKFSWDITSPHSIIVGTNGAGKSSLLREMHPLPATSTDYGQNGYKKAIYHHGLSEYIVVSDFSKKSKPHSFKKDGEELNESGSTSVQEELVRVHLGYTPTVHAIMTGAYKFSSMSAGQRKSLLMSLDPADVGFLLDWHKLVASQLRAFKNNLTMLHERKAALESEMLDVKLKDALSAENTQLTEELSKVIEYCYKVEAHLQSQRQPTTAPLQLNAIKTEVISILHGASQYKDIPRGTTDQYQQQLNAELATAQARLMSVEQALHQVVAEIERCESHLAQVDDTTDVKSEISDKIATLEAEIVALTKDTTDLPFDALLMHTVDRQLADLSDLVRTLIGADPDAIRSPIYTRRLRMHYQAYAQKARAYAKQEQDLVHQMQELEKDLVQKQELQIPSNCPRRGCSLLDRYTQVVSGTKQRYDDISAQVLRLQSRKKRCSNYVDMAEQRLKMLDQYAPCIQRIGEYLSEYGYLRIPLRDVDLLTILKVNPYGVVSKIQEHQQRSRNHHRIAAARAELEVLQTKYTTVSTPFDSNRMFLTDTVLEKTVQKQALLDEHTRLELQIADLQTKQDMTASYLSAVQRLNTYAKQVYASASDYVAQHD